MPNKYNQIISFPKDFPNATTGVFLADMDLLITGHENGLVVKWETKNDEPKILYRCSSKIETISSCGNGRILVGSHNGDLFILNCENPKNPEFLQEATYSVSSRVWRTVWPMEKNLVATSTYGVMTGIRKSEHGQWEKYSISGHRNSIFALGGLNVQLMASGDYTGKILIWEYQKDHYEELQQLNINQTVEDISWTQDASFASIDMAGHIHLFEKKIENGAKKWQTVLEIANAKSRGNCIHITNDGKTVFAGTDTELIQFDVDSQQIESNEIGGIIKIFSKENTILVLKKDGLLSFEREKVKPDPKLIKYKYAKISLIGHTGVGKSTLCNFITTGSAGAVKSTFGKRIWNWIIDGGPLQKRIIFHDYGGQETVLGTFLPFLADSDVILILFQQNDKHSFDKAIETLKGLEKNLNPKIKILFVQTYIDQEINEIDEPTVKALLDSGKIDIRLKVCPSDGTGIDELKDQLLEKIYWENTKIVIKSSFSDNLVKLINKLQEEDRKAIKFEELEKYHHSFLGYDMPAKHLKFLLRDFSNQGIIGYYPEASNLVIINDVEYNRLLTNIPIFVGGKKGIVPYNELLKEYKRHPYIPILDAVYLNYDIAIKNRDLRIFPEKLREEGIDVPKEYKKFLKDFEEKIFPYKEIEIGRLIRAISELNLGCIDLSQKDGLFSWEENACIYYNFQIFGDAIKGMHVKCVYYIGGRDRRICDRLKNEFESIIDKFYGPFVAIPINQNKKKVTKDNKYDVALSYASEQREYVDEVAHILQTKGIKCWYDQFYQSQLWGTDLAEYLQKVYYDHSDYCIMFISKDYVSKAWPSHERKSAIARQIKQFGDYILPVIFDDSEVPGLQSSIGYLDARKTSPKEVANSFLEKYNNSRQV